MFVENHEEKAFRFCNENESEWIGWLASGVKKKNEPERRCKMVAAAKEKQQDAVVIKIKLKKKE